MSRSRWLQWSRLTSKTRFLLAMALLIDLLAFKVLAYELHQANVTERNGVFTIQLTAILNTPAEYIRQVLTDYSHIYRLSSSIIESEVLPSDQVGVTRIRTRVLACASVFCREIERVDAIHTLASGVVFAEVVPELSEFRSGQATWTIKAMDDRTKIVYSATVEPDFYIPPIVGVPVIRNSLKDEYIATFGRLETIARINAERDWNEEHTVASAVNNNPSAPCSKELNAGLK